MNEQGKQPTTALALAYQNFSQARRNVTSGDMRGMAQVMKVESQLKKTGRIPVAFIDMTHSMVDDMSRVRPLIDKLQKLGVPVFAFGDGAIGETILEPGVNGYLEGAGNGAETPFAALTSAMMFLGRPIPGLDSKEAIIKALFGEPDINGNYSFLSDGYIKGESVVSAGRVHEVKFSLQERVRAGFGDIEEKMKTPDFDAVRNLVQMGLPIDAIIITDEMGGFELTPAFTAILKPFIEAAGGNVNEFVHQHSQTVIGQKYNWLDKLTGLAGKNVKVISITPESNLLQDYGSRGLKYLYAYWQALSAMLGGEAVRLDQDSVDYKIQALIEAGRMAETSIRQLTDTMKLLTTTAPGQPQPGPIAVQ